VCMCIYVCVVCIRVIFIHLHCALGAVIGAALAKQGSRRLSPLIGGLNAWRAANVGVYACVCVCTYACMCLCMHVCACILHLRVRAHAHVCLCSMYMYMRMCLWI